VWTMPASSWARASASASESSRFMAPIWDRDRPPSRPAPQTYSLSTNLTPLPRPCLIVPGGGGTLMELGGGSQQLLVPAGGGSFLEMP
jgi:hypothetical protein